MQINESNPRDDAISPMSPIDDDELDSDERKAKNEAKVNRKVCPIYHYKFGLVTFCVLDCRP